jgi:thiopurine S-methyltransferase
LKNVNPIIEKYGPLYLADQETSTDVNAAVDDADTNDKSCHVKERPKRVFVPLCGKTVDLAYLTTLADEVVGVEGIRMALEQFAVEHPQLNITNTKSTSNNSIAAAVDGFERWEGDKIKLLKGDYFQLDATKTDGEFDLIFDRGSMVAIEPTMRQAYVDVLGQLLAAGGTILLVVLERHGTEEGMKMGPPYSITETIVREVYEGKEWVESVKLLEQSDQLETKPEDRARFPELDHLFETVYEIKRKA